MPRSVPKSRTGNSRSASAKSQTAAKPRAAAKRGATPKPPAAGKPRAAAKARPASKPRAPKIGFVSLGCPKALVDSERILTHLRAEGYEVAPTYDAADMVVVNTCGFIDAAIDESLDA